MKRNWAWLAIVLVAAGGAWAGQIEIGPAIASFDQHVLIGVDWDGQGDLVVVGQGRRAPVLATAAGTGQPGKTWLRVVFSPVTYRWMLDHDLPDDCNLSQLPGGPRAIEQRVAGLRVARSDLDVVPTRAHALLVAATGWSERRASLALGIPAVVEPSAARLPLSELDLLRMRLVVLADDTGLADTKVEPALTSWARKGGCLVLAGSAAAAARRNPTWAALVAQPQVKAAPSAGVPGFTATIIGSGWVVLVDGAAPSDAASWSRIWLSTPPGTPVLAAGAISRAAALLTRMVNSPSPPVGLVVAFVLFYLGALWLVWRQTRQKSPSARWLALIAVAVLAASAALGAVQRWYSSRDTTLAVDVLDCSPVQPVPSLTRAIYLSAGWPAELELIGPLSGAQIARQTTRLLQGPQDALQTVPDWSGGSAYAFPESAIGAQTVQWSDSVRLRADVPARSARVFILIRPDAGAVGRLRMDADSTDYIASITNELKWTLRGVRMRQGPWQADLGDLQPGQRADLKLAKWARCDLNLPLESPAQPAELSAERFSTLLGEIRMSPPPPPPIGPARADTAASDYASQAMNHDFELLAWINPPTTRALTAPSHGAVRHYMCVSARGKLRRVAEVALRSGTPLRSAVDLPERLLDDAAVIPLPARISPADSAAGARVKVCKVRNYRLSRPDDDRPITALWLSRADSRSTAKQPSPVRWLYDPQRHELVRLRLGLNWLPAGSAPGGRWTILSTDGDKGPDDLLRVGADPDPRRWHLGYVMPEMGGGL